MRPLLSAILPPKTSGIAAIFMLTFSSPGHVFAQDQVTPIAEIAACRSIVEARLRLDCMDRVSDRLLQAHERGELTIIDRAQVHEARRRLFGFSGTAFPSFFGKEDEAEEISAVETTLTRLARDGAGHWVFHLADGSEWRQVDNESPHLRAQSGAEVRVRRAAFGSYFLNVGDARAIRVRRQ